MKKDNKKNQLLRSFAQAANFPFAEARKRAYWWGIPHYFLGEEPNGSRWWVELDFTKNEYRIVVWEGREWTKAVRTEGSKLTKRLVRVTRCLRGWKQK